MMSSRHRRSSTADSASSADGGRRRSGFSLIEVLVATTLLVVIVIMVGMVFRQSSLSWQSGIARADGNMLIRTAVGSIERDLRAAVDARAYPGIGFSKAMHFAWDKLEFVALLEGTSAKREPTLVVITAGGHEVRRQATRLRYTGSSWAASGDAEQTYILHTETTDKARPYLWFECPDPDSADLPRWVTTFVQMIPGSGYHGVRARSLGRDKLPDTGDDIEAR